MDSSTQAVDHFSDVNAHVESLVAHYRLSSDVAAALGTLAAMVLDPTEGVLPFRPATNGLVATRLSSCAAAFELPLVRSARRVVDIGSGLGFPGLVLASMLPQATFTLVEANEARCAFLGRAVDAMDLTNVEVVNRQAQRWIEGATSAELVTARALGRLRVMVRLAAPLLDMGGTVVIFGKPKREAAKEAEAEDVAGAVGMRPVTVHETTPVGIGARHLYVYEKVAATPARQAVKMDRTSGRKARMRTRAVGAVKAEWNAAERLERAKDRVRRLEASSADPDSAAELERARAVVQKMERRLGVLTQRRVRAERRLERSESGLGKDEIERMERPRGAAV